MSRRKKTFFDESLDDNMITYGHYIQRLTELSIAMFEWKNLPDSVDPRFLELTLFSDGHAVFFKDEVLGYLGLQVLINGRLNVYRIPTSRRAYAINGYNKVLDESNSVIIFNNMLHNNSYPAVRLFAKRLYNIDRIIEVNANAQKTPVLVQGTETQRLSLLNMYQKWDGNEPVIFADNSLDAASLRVLKTDAPYLCDKLYQLKTQIWNEALTYLGISNLNIQKKERLVADEVTRSIGGTIASRYSRLEARRTACLQINKLFGLDLEVDFRQDYREADDETIFPGPTGGGGAVDQVIDLRTK